MVRVLEEDSLVVFRCRCRIALHCMHLSPSSLRQAGGITVSTAQLGSWDRDPGNGDGPDGHGGREGKLVSEKDTRDMLGCEEDLGAMSANGARDDREMPLVARLP